MPLYTQMLMDGLFTAIFLQVDKRPLTLNYKEAPKAITLEDVKNESPANRTGSTLDCESAPKKGRLCLPFLVRRTEQI